MPNETPGNEQIQRRFNVLRTPLFKLLAINLAAGTAAAALLVGGLLALNLFRLRDLIFADNSPGIALGLLLFGFVVTFGSSAMGSAIMAMGKWEKDEEGPRGTARLVAVTKPQSSDKNCLRVFSRETFKDVDARVKPSPGMTTERTARRRALRGSSR